MKDEIIYFSSILTNNDTACEKFETKKQATAILKEAAGLFNSLKDANIPYGFIKNTGSNIWMRDFMPVKTKSGHVSFQYEPSYNERNTEYNIDNKDPLIGHLKLPGFMSSEVNLDGGNVVFSPDKSKVIISNRVFAENQDWDMSELIEELNTKLDAQVIFIPSDIDDFTGHADGMVRFIDNDTVVGNDSKDEFEQYISEILQRHSIETIPFPCGDMDEKNDADDISAVGCYINYLETEKFIFLPKFCVDDKKDSEAFARAKEIFESRNKQVEQIYVNEIAKAGGVLNCISWEL